MRAPVVFPSQELAVNEHAQTGGAEPVLELKGLSKSFGGLHAVRDVTLSIMRGDRKAIIGPNGAGKTTLFNVITGIYPASAGQVVLFGGMSRAGPAIGGPRSEWRGHSR